MAAASKAATALRSKWRAPRWRPSAPSVGHPAVAARRVQRHGHVSGSRRAVSGAHQGAVGAGAGVPARAGPLGHGHAARARRVEGPTAQRLQRGVHPRGWLRPGQCGSGAGRQARRSHRLRPRVLASPDLVARMRSSAPLNAPDMSTFYTPGAKGYTDYPALEVEPALRADAYRLTAFSPSQKAFSCCACGGGSLPARRRVARFDRAQAEEELVFDRLHLGRILRRRPPRCSTARSRTSRCAGAPADAAPAPTASCSPGSVASEASALALSCADCSASSQARRDCTSPASSVGRCAELGQRRVGDAADPAQVELAGTTRRATLMRDSCGWSPRKAPSAPSTTASRRPSGDTASRCRLCG